MRCVLLVSFVLCVFVGKSAPAQIVDVQRLFAGEQADGLVVGVDGAVDVRRGDVELTSLSGGVNARARRGELAALLLVQGERGEAGGNAFVEKDLEHLRVRSVGRRIQAETFIQHDRDRFRRRELRALWGVGPRLAVADSAARSLALGAACMAEYERLSAGPFADSGQVTIRTRGSLYANGRIRLDEHLAAGQTLYVQPRVDAPSDVRLLSESELIVALAARLSIKLSASLSHDAAPPDQVDPWQVALKTSFHLDFAGEAR